MIGRFYRLVDTKRIEMKEREIRINANTVLVQPEYLSICAADQRYYLGQRKKEVLNQKLPMALIHEATGTVIYDFTGKLKTGAKVVLIPLEESCENQNFIKGNYRENSRFASSGVDGFMRDIVAIDAERLISVGENYSVVHVFVELLSVAVGAIGEFDKTRRTPPDSIGVWGDGSVGFVTALALRCKYPGTKLYVFGKSARKLSMFSFVTHKYYINNVPEGLRVNHAFECVGGRKSEDALRHIIDLIYPQGTVNLLGVSEDSISIETRRVLDKGLQIIGSSRSDRSDFLMAVNLINTREMCRKYLSLLISETIEIKNEKDISRWFEHDILNDFKTLGIWRI